MSVPLEDYALIGDCETAALVSRGGSIDWLCWPRFDSGACFAALRRHRGARPLADRAGGRPRAIVAGVPRGTRSSSRRRSRLPDGAATLIDFMPPRGTNSDVVRLVRGDRGRVRMRVDLRLRFDYGSTVPWVSRLARRRPGGRLPDRTWSRCAPR